MLQMTSLPLVCVAARSGALCLSAPVEATVADVFGKPLLLHFPFRDQIQLRFPILNSLVDCFPRILQIAERTVVLS